MRPRLRRGSLLPLLLLLAAAVAGLLPGPASGVLTGATPPPVLSTSAPREALPMLDVEPAIRAAERADAGPSPGVSCGGLAGRFGELYEGPELPIALDPSEEGACLLGADEAGVGLLSEAPSSASRFSLSVQLPASGSPERAIDGFGVSLEVSGVNCSVDGASYLTLDLVPPYGGRGPSASPDWSLWAPVWDLVAGGSCDPRCQNASALLTLPGSSRQFCEEEAVRSGVGLRSSTEGTFSPGDLLDLTFVGSPGGLGGLDVFVNDTTRPADSLSWSYDRADSVGDQLIEPLDAASTAGSGAWAEGPALSLVAYLCPSQSALPSACDSYDGPATESTGLPTVTALDSWNGSTGAYTDPYPTVEPFSTSGACSGASAAYPCEGFEDDGGTGYYPDLGLVGQGGVASLSIDAPPAATGTFGSPAEYSASGAPGPAIPAVSLSSLSNVSSSSGLNVTARISSLAGLADGELTGYSCFSSSTPSVQSVPLVEDPGTENGSSDGNFSGSLSYSFASHGPLYYWLRGASPGGFLTAPVRGVADHAGGGSTCLFPDPPAPDFSAANVTAIGGGYRISLWDNDSAVTNFTLEATRPGSPVVETTNVEGTGTVDWSFGGDGYGWDLTAVATDAAGRSSAAAGPVDASPALATLSATLDGPNDTAYWSPSSTLWFNASVAGGVAPYQYRLSLGNGMVVNSTLSAASENVTHQYVDFVGVAIVSLEVTDAVGESAAAVPLAYTIFDGPTGLNQTLGGGSTDVGVSWNTTEAPTPVSLYTVFYTANASLAPSMTSIWPDNDSAAGLYLWNTTQLTLDVAQLETGTVVYALVVAWDAGGVGLTPAGWFDVPSAVVEPFVASAITVTPPGGPAPLTALLSTTVTSGTNASIDEAIYTCYPGDTVAEASVTGNVSIWWLNATVTLNGSGTFTVILHAADSFGDVAIPITTLYVAPSSPPTVSAQVTSGLARLGQPVFFSASAFGGTGVGDSFNWSFGDGGTASGALASHTYETAGNYTVVVTATDLGDGLVAYGTVPVHVYGPLEVLVRASATDATGTDYNLTAYGSGGVGNLTYAWTLGDGSTAVGRSVDHHYTSPGTYEVNVTVTDSTGATASAEVTVAVPAPSVTSSSGLSPLVTAALIALGAIAAVAVVAAAYLYSRGRPEGGEADEIQQPPWYGQGPAEPGETGPPAIQDGELEPATALPAPEEEEPSTPSSVVRAPPPPDPPDPS